MSSKWSDLGCWKDTPDRAISGGFVGYPGATAYNVQKCYDHAVSKGHDIFSLQAGFACFTGKEGVDNYKKYGSVPGTCPELGDAWNNHVYKVKPVGAAPPATPPSPPPAPVAPHVVGTYSDWTPITSMLTDFQSQATGLVASLSNPDTSNPAPFMTALDTDVNAIRDQVKIEELKAVNAKNVKDATKLFREATDMSDTLSEGKNEAEVLRRQITLSTSQAEAYKSKFLPLQILVATLAIVLFVYFLAGFVLPGPVASIIAMVVLASGFGAAVYFAVKQN